MRRLRVGSKILRSRCPVRQLVVIDGCGSSAYAWSGVEQKAGVVNFATTCQLNMD